MKLGNFLLVATLVATIWSLGNAKTANVSGSISRVEEIETTRPETRITALRKLWSSWDRRDPQEVEEALLSATRSSSLAPGVRAYAALLAAYARSRRGDTVTAGDNIARLGYVDRWVVVGPFDNEGKRGFAQDFEPEREFGEVLSLAKSYQGKERTVRWRVVPNDFSLGWLDLGALLRPQKSICAYATTFVQADAHHEAKISAWVGAAGAFRLYLNGENVLQDEHYRGHDVDRLAVTLALANGFNELTLKACGTESAPVVSLRLADIRGNPAPDIKWSNDLADGMVARTSRHGREKRAAIPADKPADGIHPRGRPASLPPQSVRGPIQVFASLIAKRQVPPSTFADYAEYLLTTHGDDPAEHQARDLATRAAEEEPSVSHLLLAASLAEDRNQRARWLEKAEALPSVAGEDGVRLMLARAAHERSGPHPQDSVPWFNRVLAVDPANVEATVQLADLYTAFGLDQSALVLIDQTLNRVPHSVRLLAAKSERLRKLGRSAEASEVERQYANVRFDDAAWLGKMVDLSLARQDTAAVRWWTN